MSKSKNMALAEETVPVGQYTRKGFDKCRSGVRR